MLIGELEQSLIAKGVDPEYLTKIYDIIEDDFKYQETLEVMDKIIK